MQHTLCKCGCGGEIPARTKRSRKNVKYLPGHYVKHKGSPMLKITPSDLAEIPSGFCACNCGEKLPDNRAKHVRFLHRHHLKLNRGYIPKPEEIPSGICECGCGKKTEIAKYTNLLKKVYKGYPVRFVKNHNHPGKQRLRENHPSWKGGRVLGGEGYVLIKPPIDYPTKRQYILEHRYVMEQKLGRRLESFEQVHHINGKKDDNRPENLELWDRSQPNGVRINDFHCAGCRCFDHK